jgi:hypothetical protein
MLYSAAVPRAVATSYDCTACCDARSRSQLLATRARAASCWRRACCSPPMTPGRCKRAQHSYTPAFMGSRSARPPLVHQRCSTDRGLRTRYRHGAVRARLRRRSDAAPPAGSGCAAQPPGRSNRGRHTPARPHARTLARSHAPHHPGRTLRRRCLPFATQAARRGGGRGGGQAWRRTRAAPALSARCRPTGRRLQSGHVQRHRGLRRHRPKHPALLSLLCPKIDRASWGRKRKKDWGGPVIRCFKIK